MPKYSRVEFAEVDLTKYSHGYDHPCQRCRNTHTRFRIRVLSMATRRETDFYFCAWHEPEARAMYAEFKAA